MALRRTVLCVALVLAAAPPAAAASEPTLATVLERAGAYVAMVERGVSGIVTEEHYGQQWTVLPKGAINELRHRDLVSDLLIVKLEAAGLWLQFRDVFDVDGALVHDRDERLMKLFLQPAGTAQEQLDAILSESARYNVGNIERNVNTPLLTMFFLDPRHQRRFRFFRTKDRNPALATASDASRPPADA